MPKTQQHETIQLYSESLRQAFRQRNLNFLQLRFNVRIPGIVMKWHCYYLLDSIRGECSSGLGSMEHV